MEKRVMRDLFNYLDEQELQDLCQFVRDYSELKSRYDFALRSANVTRFILDYHGLKIVILMVNGYYIDIYISE